jgi:hypothetical protein
MRAGPGAAHLRSRWEVSLLLGPHPSAADMCEWEYARAVSAMRASDRPTALTVRPPRPGPRRAVPRRAAPHRPRRPEHTEARPPPLPRRACRGVRRRASDRPNTPAPPGIQALGRAVQLMQGLTVPHHATDTGAGLPGSHKAEYERLCDDMLRNARRAPAPRPRRPAPAPPRHPPPAASSRRRLPERRLPAPRPRSLGAIASVHPAVGGIYCDACPPTEFAETVPPAPPRRALPRPAAAVRGPGAPPFARPSRAAAVPPTAPPGRNAGVFFARRRRTSRRAS